MKGVTCTAPVNQYVQPCREWSV